MNTLARVFRRTPSLQSRVAFATGIAAAIVVGIVGTIVWIGITNDRKERLDRRLDEAAGFAIPFLPRGLDEIPRPPHDENVVITARRNGQVSSNSNVVLPELPVGYADTDVNGIRYRVRTVQIHMPDPMLVAVGATYDATIVDTNNLHRRVIALCAFAIGAAAVAGWALAAFAVRPLKRLAQQTRDIDPEGDAPHIDVRGATEAVEIADAVKGLVDRVWEEKGRTKAALA
ncbi:MAG: HAMP domain-containing protein, partial [Chitinophagaceae bacterium]